MYDPFLILIQSVVCSYILQAGYINQIFPPSVYIYK